jgi:hypothetical protein
MAAGQQHDSRTEAGRQGDQYGEQLPAARHTLTRDNGTAHDHYKDTDHAVWQQVDIANNAMRNQISYGTYMIPMARLDLRNFTKDRDGASHSSPDGSYWSGQAVDTDLIDLQD